MNDGTFLQRAEIFTVILAVDCAPLGNLRNAPTQIGRANKLMNASQSQTSGLTFFFVCSTWTQWSGNHWQNYSIPNELLSFSISDFYGDLIRNKWEYFLIVFASRLPREEERHDGMASIAAGYFINLAGTVCNFRKSGPIKAARLTTINATQRRNNLRGRLQDKRRNFSFACRWVSFCFTFSLSLQHKSEFFS